MEHIKTDKILSLAWKTAYMFVNLFAELVHAYWRVSFVFVVFVVAFVLLFCYLTMCMCTCYMWLVV